MANENPSYYSILTSDVRYSKTLTDLEKLLFSEITALSNKNGYCSATNTYFSRLYSKSKGTISRSISDLKDEGFINVVLEREGKQIKSRKIYPLSNTKMNPIPKNDDTPIPKNEHTPIPKNDKGGILKNDKENNTSINNTSNNNMSNFSPTAKNATTSDDLSLANYLWERIKENNPDAKEPNFDKWANVIRLMHQRDKRDYGKITKMIDWCQNHEFWSSVILSPNKLRKQYDQMNAQAARELKTSQKKNKDYKYDQLF